MTQPLDYDAAIAGLARDLEQQRRRLHDLVELPDQISELTSVVTALAERQATGLPSGTTGPVSWLGFVVAAGDLDAPVAAARLLTDLVEWMNSVYLRYPDAAQALPGCWLWHPDVVEELLWLRQAWAAAYGGGATSPALAGDWHDRQRPGVVRRMKASAGACSVESHLPGGDRNRPPAVAPLAPAIGVIARWWTGDRDSPAPPPVLDGASDHAARRLA